MSPVTHSWLSPHVMQPFSDKYHSSNKQLCRNFANLVMPAL